MTRCGTSTIGLNELLGAQLPAPWAVANSVYRADVLAFVRALAERGAQPHLFISQGAATAGAAGDWWRAVAEAATIVREVYVPAKVLSSLGSTGASVYFRYQLRRAVRNLTMAGIPSSRIGLALGFQTDASGRDGLAAPRWYEVVKRETLAARRVSSELGLESVWSWGWAAFGGGLDPTQQRAACVYLWARNPVLCDARRAVGRGFDASRAQPAERTGERLRMRVVGAGQPTWLAIHAGARLTGRVAYVQRRSRSGWISVERVVLQPFGPLRVKLDVPPGRCLLRVYVVPEAAPGGAAITTPATAIRVR